jgi:hypothetical protein
LSNPSGVYISPSGELYVADEGNNRVQKYTSVNNIDNKFTPTVAGKYRVIAVCSNGLTDTSAEVEIGPDQLVASASDVSAILPGGNVQKSLSVYPNPAQSYTTLKFMSTKQEKITVQINDVSGRVVIRKEYTVSVGENVLRVDVSILARGNFMINVISEGKSSQSSILQKL